MSQKNFWLIRRAAVMAVIFAAALIVGCGYSGLDESGSEEGEEIVIVVPSDGKSAISSLVSEYERINNDSEIKLINIGGTDEEAYRLCVSLLLDKKFNADILIIDDVWLSAFADENLVSEITDTDDKVFIPAARRAMTFNDKIYGIPIYADAMASFEKYGGNSNAVMYFEDGASDMAAHIRDGIDNGLSLGAAHKAYAEATKCKALSEFIDSDAGVLKTWISQLDVIQKYYPMAAVNMKIKLDDNALVRTKLAIINKESRSYNKSLKLIKYLLSDKSQQNIMSNMPGVPVLQKNYGDVYTADRLTYIDGIDGEKFCTFPFSVDFKENEFNLEKTRESNASYEETERALEYMANPQ